MNNEDISVFFALVFAWRLFVGVCVITTYFNPDEFWQGPEVAYRMVFPVSSSSVITWEWQDHARLRGFAHPLLFAVPFQLLRWTGVDLVWPSLLVYVPRIVQAALAAALDRYTFLLAKNYFGRRVAFMALFCQLTSWFSLYCFARPFSNGIETLCIIAALYHHQAGRWRWTLHLLGLGVLFRPTLLLVALPVVVHMLMCDARRVMVPLVATVGIYSGLSVAIDSIGYGVVSFVPWNFFAFNAVHAVGSLYGTHSWHWYLSEGLPSMLGTATPLVALSLFTQSSSNSSSNNHSKYKKRLMALCGWIVIVYSLNAHKEMRFVLSALPLLFILAGVYLAEANTRQTKAWMILLLSTNAIALFYFGQVHQSGPVSVMTWLRQQPPHKQDRKVLFLMPCHATPWLSHVHRDPPMQLEMLDCSPHVLPGDPTGQLTRSDTPSAQFEANPYAFTVARPGLTSVGTVFVFDEHATAAGKALQEAGFLLSGSFFHSHLETSKRIMMYVKRLDSL